MARPTRHDGIVQDYEVGPGMKIFAVTKSTIVDSTGAYCCAGQQAALNKADATRYHKLNLIQVALPDFDEEKPNVTSKPAADASAEASAATGEVGGEGAEPATVDGAGGRTTRRV